MSSMTTLPLDELKAVCARFGLEIVAARRHGVMLTLVPCDLEHIPDAQALREIADALGGDGIRYVTLDLDPPQ
jgi:hypothetical protein